MAASGSRSEEMPLRCADATTKAASPRATAVWRVALLPALLGVAAGLAKVFLDQGLGLPGHSVLWWFTPILAAKVATRARFGATGASVTAGGVVAVLSHGFGRVMAPVEFAASGLAADLLLGGVRFQAVSPPKLFAVAGLSGVMANLARLAFKMLLFSRPGPHWRLGAAGLGWRVASYAVFGAASGLLVAAVYLVSRRQRRKSRNASGDASD